MFASTVMCSASPRSKVATNSAGTTRVSRDTAARTVQSHRARFTHAARWILGFLALALLFDAMAPTELASAQRRRRSRRPGSVVLLGNFDGAEVFVDGEEVGEMPMEPLSLEPGTYSLRVTLPGHTTFTEEVRVRSRRETEIYVDMLAVKMLLSLRTRPDGANVYIDEEFMGATPILDLELSEGRHDLRLELDGYEGAEREIEGAAGERMELTLTLEELPEPEVLPEPDLRVRRSAQEDESEWFEEPLPWILLGAGALLIAGAVIMIVILTGSDIDSFCGEVGATCFDVQ